MSQVGWLGQTGTVYPLDGPSPSLSEPGSYQPIYIQIGTWREIEPGTWIIDE
jgi:hypothetical protein